MKVKLSKKDRKVIGEYLKDARLKKGFSQIELSNVLGYESGQSISNWERGLGEVPIDKLGKIVRVLDIDEGKLVRLILKCVSSYLWSKVAP